MPPDAYVYGSPLMLRRCLIADAAYDVAAAACRRCLFVTPLAITRTIMPTRHAAAGSIYALCAKSDARLRTGRVVERQAHAPQRVR